MSAIPKPTGTVDQTDLIGLSGEISALMSGYCDAIGACKSIPVLSVLPLPKLYFQLLLWIISFELCFLLVPIDLCLYLARHLFGRPRFLLGRSVYAYLRSVWDGEIPAFKILRMRYLTRLLLFYRAQAKINALHSVFNRRHLNLLFADPPNDAAVSEAEKFQKSFDLFQKITTDSYQIGVLAIGGPFVALLTITVQKGVLPFASFLWGYFGGPKLSISQIGTLGGFFIIFAVMTIWILVSAWIDMRSTIVGLGIPKIERHANAYAGIGGGRQIPFDILFYMGLVGSLTFSFYVTFSRAMERATANSDRFQEARLEMLRMEALNVGPTLPILLCLGLIALARRLWLSRSASPNIEDAP